MAALDGQQKTNSMEAPSLIMLYQGVGQVDLCHQTEELVRGSKPKSWEISELRTVGVWPAPFLALRVLEQCNHYSPSGGP